MTPAKEEGRAGALPSLLAGLEAGVVAALFMLGWLLLASAWYRRSVWALPNLFASAFYGEAALRRGFSWFTFSGLAVHLLLYGALGALFGFLVRDRCSHARLLLFAVGTALAWYFAWYPYVWSAINPLIPLYTPDRAMLAAHLLYGVALARYPNYLNPARALVGA